MSACDYIFTRNIFSECCKLLLVYFSLGGEVLSSLHYWSVIGKDIVRCPSVRRDDEAHKPVRPHYHHLITQQQNEMVMNNAPSDHVKLAEGRSFIG